MLLVAKGAQNKDIAAEVGLDRRQVDMVERFFRDITEMRTRCDSFTSVLELEPAIDLCVAQHNVDPKHFIWTASASAILAKGTRAKAAIFGVIRKARHCSGGNDHFFSESAEPRRLIHEGHAYEAHSKAGQRFERGLRRVRQVECLAQEAS